MATTETWRINPAGGMDYTTLTAWEAAKQADIVAADKVMVAECYAGADTGGAMSIVGWTTDATRYIRIVAATGAEAKVPYNTSTAYRYEPPTDATTSIMVSEEYVRIERIQIQPCKTAGSARNDGAIGYSALTGGALLVDRCVIKPNIGAGNADGSLGIYVSDSDPNPIDIRNTFIIGYNQTGMTAFHSDSAGTVVNLYNVTVVDCVKGFVGAGTGYLLKNCAYYSNGLGSADGYSGTFSASSNYNASDLAADAGGANSKNSVTPTFVSSGTGDWHLASSDTAWKDSGVDLSGTFTVDFDGDTRSGTWDIGADEVTTVAASVSAGRPNLLDMAPVPIRPGQGPWALPFMPAEFRSRQNARFNMAQGTIAPSGALVNQPVKLVGGTVTSAGANVKTPAKVLSGSVAPSGANVKTPGKVLAGGITPAGTNVKSAAKGLAGAITLAGTDVLTAGKSLAGTVALAGGLVKVPGKVLAGTVAAAGSLVKSVFKLFAGGITPSGALDATRVLLLSVAGSIASSGALVKLVGKTPSGAVTPSGTMLKSASKTMAGTIAPTGTMRKLAGKILAGVLSLVGSLLAERPGVLLVSLRNTVRAQDRRVAVDAEARARSVAAQPRATNVESS